MLKLIKLSSEALKLSKFFKTSSTVLKQGALTIYLAPIAGINVCVLSDVIIHDKHVLHSWRGDHI